MGHPYFFFATAPLVSRPKIAKTARSKHRVLILYALPRKYSGRAFFLFF